MVDAHGDSGDFVGLAKELKELHEVALALFKVPDGAVHLLHGRIEHAADLRILHCELVAVGIHQFIDDFLQVFGQVDFFKEIVERCDVVGDRRVLFECVLELDEGAEAAHAIFVDGLEAVGVVTAEFVAVAVRMTGPAGRFIRLPAASVNEPHAGVSLQRIAFLGREIAHAALDILQHMLRLHAARGAVERREHSEHNGLLRDFVFLAVEVDWDAVPAADRREDGRVLIELAQDDGDVAVAIAVADSFHNRAGDVLALLIRAGVAEELDVLLCAGDSEVFDDLARAERLLQRGERGMYLRLFL